MVRYRKPAADVDRALAGLRAEALACRDLRHAWAVDVPLYVVQVEGGMRGAVYAERRCGCMRCGTERVELYRVYGDRLERLRTSYAYPEGYRLPHGALPKGTNVAAVVRHLQWEAVSR